MGMNRLTAKAESRTKTVMKQLDIKEAVSKQPQLWLVKYESTQALSFKRKKGFKAEGRNGTRTHVL